MRVLQGRVLNLSLEGTCKPKRWCYLFDSPNQSHMHYLEELKPSISLYDSPEQETAPGTFFLLHPLIQPVFRIRFILIWIRIRIVRSVSCNNGSGSISCSGSDLKSRKYQIFKNFFFYQRYISSKNYLFCYL